MTWLTLLDVPYVTLENVVASMETLSVRSAASLPPLRAKHLRKTYTTGTMASLPFGIDVRRISEYEPASLQTRGTLGGFTSLSDFGRAGSDGSSLGKDKSKEKECVLTTLTKKVGLGIYHRSRTPSPFGEREERGDWSVDGDERETWYMLYPPPPSPSLVLESTDWNSVSSNLDSRPQSTVTRDSTRREADDESLRERTSTESLYASDAPGSLTPDANPLTDIQGIGQDTHIASVENLAQQYRDILPLSPSPGYFSLPDPAPQTVPILLIDTPLPVALPPPKTIRKVKAQQSLRDIVDLRSQRPISSISFSPVEEINPFIETFSHSSKIITKRKHVSHRKHAPSPPPRQSSLSFASNSSYHYSPGHGPRRTHGQKHDKQTSPQPWNAPEEFDFHFAMDTMEQSNGIFHSPPFYQYQPPTNSADGLDGLFPRPLTIRRPGMGMKYPSPPPDPIRWEVPPVPPVPTIIILRPLEKATNIETAMSTARSTAMAMATTDQEWFGNRKGPRVPLRGGMADARDLINPFDMTWLRDVEGSWI